MTRWLRVLLLLPAGLLGMVLLLELLLQLGALVVKDQARQVEARWLTGHTRILALGDSNTYGFYLEAHEAWPAQLEQQWNSAHPDHLIEVLNLGYPGTNSFRVRDNLPTLLDKLAPDVVLVMVGFNDFWTPVEDINTGAASNALDTLKQHSRLYHLYVMWQRSRIKQEDLAFGSPRRVEMQVFDPSNREQHLVHMDGQELYMGTRQGEPARNRHALADNLAAMISMVRARGAQVYLLTYPSNWGFYPGANQWLKKSSGQTGTPLIDITPLFVAQCSEGPPSCPGLLFGDGHATAQGNALVSTRVMQELAPVLLH